MLRPGVVALRKCVTSAIRQSASARSNRVRAPPEEPNVETGQPQKQSQLFTVRLWAEDLGNGRTEWRGQVQHVLSGEVHYFREWPALIAWLIAMLPPTETTPTTDDIHAGLEDS
jgi:hypothetical protein